MKKHIPIILIVTSLFIVGCIYFPQTEWVSIAGGEGNFSKDTYLFGGTGYGMYFDEVRIYYNFIIESGMIRYELLDKNGNVVYEIEAEESCDGYITFDNETPELYYDRIYTLSEDTIADTYTTVEVLRSNFEKLLRKIRTLSDDKLFKNKFNDDIYFTVPDTEWPSWTKGVTWESLQPKH